MAAYKLRKCFLTWDEIHLTHQYKMSQDMFYDNYSSFVKSMDPKCDDAIWVLNGHSYSLTLTTHVGVFTFVYVLKYPYVYIGHTELTVQTRGMPKYLQIVSPRKHQSYWLWNCATVCHFPRYMMPVAYRDFTGEEFSPT